LKTSRPARPNFRRRQFSPPNAQIRRRIGIGTPSNQSSIYRPISFSFDDPLDQRQQASSVPDLALGRSRQTEPAWRRCRPCGPLIEVARCRDLGERRDRARSGMDVFIQQLINGITLGSIYGLIAIGYTMVFGILGMVNFAHGDVFMVSTFIALIAFLILTTWLGIGSVVLALLIVLVVAMLLTSLVNWAIERMAYRPLRGSYRLAPLISAIGMSILLMNFVQVAQGPRNKSIPPFFNEVIVLMESSDGYDVAVSYKQIAVWAVTAVLLAAFWFLVSKTALGRAQRACEQDQKMAALLGIDVDRTISITFVIAAALAAVAGTMYLMYYGVVSFADGFVPGVKAFTAAVLGGIGSLPGAVLGGLLIGLIETLWSAYFSTDYKDVAAFSILVITMIFLPQGILGHPDVEKV
jgi:branched-chain amino acid transport system permease protein